MSRNRLKNSQSLHWAGVAKLIVVVAMLALLAVTHVFIQNQILRLAEENRRHEKDLSNWQERNRQLKHNIAQLKSPDELKRRIAGMGLVNLGELPYVPMDAGETTRVARNTAVPGGAP